MKYKTAIIDDNALQRDFLNKTVTEWAKRNRHILEIKTYPDAKAFLFDYEEEKDFDILLLDIEMPEINGIELAKIIRKENSVIQIIFITGFYDYFSDGFDVSALHYLIKPVDSLKLCPILDKAVNNLNYRQRSVLINTPDVDIKIPLADIMYIESENVYIIIHTTDANYKTRLSLSKFTEQLDDTFIKVHRSFTVCLKYIKKISRTEITVLNGDRIPISRGMYDEIHNALIKFL